MTVYRFADFPSRNPIRSADTAHRLDPYFDGLWSAGSSASWLSAREVLRQREAGLLAENRWARPQPFNQALEQVCKEASTKASLRGLAALNLWRTLTAEQLAAYTGSIAYSRGDLKLHRLFSTGLIELGRIISVAHATGFPLLARPSNRGDWAGLYDRLSFDDWVGLTAGQNWRWGSQHDRHNVLSAEIALRAAEYLPEIELVLGEQLCALQKQNLPGLTIPAQSTHLAADAMLVRDDGLRIMVETTASSRGLEDKARRWAEVLATDVSRSMVVVFLLASHPDRASQMTRPTLTRAVAHAARDQLSYRMAGVPQRMMVAAWSDWFPGRHQFTDRFVRLRGTVPTGMGSNPWEPIDLVGSQRCDGPRTSQRTLLDNASALYGIPQWQRKVPLSPRRMWYVSLGVDRFPRMQGIKPPPQVRARAAEDDLSDLSWSD